MRPDPFGKLTVRLSLTVLSQSRRRVTLSESRRVTRLRLTPTTFQAIRGSQRSPEPFLGCLSHASGCIRDA